MGLGSFLLGVGVGGVAVFFFIRGEAEAEPGPPIVSPEPLEESIDIFVDPMQIDSDRWQFEATYRNRTNRELRTVLVFELRDPQNGQVFQQEQDLVIDPNSTVQVFWDTEDIQNFANIEGDYTALFRVEELFNRNQLARPFTVIIPVTFPSPMVISIG